MNRKKKQNALYDILSINMYLCVNRTFFFFINKRFCRLRTDWLNTCFRHKSFILHITTISSSEVLVVQHKYIKYEEKIEYQEVEPVKTWKCWKKNDWRCVKLLFKAELQQTHQTSCLCSGSAAPCWRSVFILWWSITTTAACSGYKQLHRTNQCL